MLGKRRLRHEMLECRRLLAADCGPVDSLPTETDAYQVLQTGTTAEAEAVSRGEIAYDVIGQAGLHHLSYVPDLVHEQGNKLFVVDQDPFSVDGGSLIIFERNDDGSLESLEKIEEIEVGFSVQRMIVAGDQVLLFGSQHGWALPAVVEDRLAVLPEFPQTSVVTVNIGPDVEVIRQDLQGRAINIHHEDDRIVIVSTAGDRAAITFYPRPEIRGAVTTFDITDDGLQAVASQEIPLFGLSGVNDRGFYSAATSLPNIVYFTPDGTIAGSDHRGESNSDESGEAIRAPDEPNRPVVTVSRFLLGDDATEEVDSLELGVGFLTRFEVSPDGQTAVVVRSEFNGAGPTTHVDLLDLSDERVRGFESLELPEFSGQVMVAGPDYVVLRSYRDNTLVIIDANQQIDIAAENRVRRIEIPETLHVGFESLQVSDDRLVLHAARTADGTEPGSADGTEPGTDGQPIRQRREHILLTISMSQASIIGDAHLPSSVVPLSSHPFYLIDAESERFGFLVRGATSANGESSERPRFLFGRLAEDGEFDQDGSVPVGRWLEIDANADRLIVRQSERILEYDWDYTEEPIVTPLGEPAEPTIEAVNDEYTLIANGEDHLLDVLANDLIERFDFSRAEIVELIGAPDGAEIVGGNQVRIPAAALRDVESLRFEYVISDGQSRSSAVVEIEVESISEDEVRQLVAAVRRQAAEDFNVSVDEIVITAVERIFTEPLPIVIPGSPEVLDLSPGILVTLTAPGALALYAASLEGEIIQVFASHREILVELGLRAVDENGQTLEAVTEGDTFWLEFIADDLRPRGLGVYAAFLDLVVPTEHLVITGPVEYGVGFSRIAGGEFDEGEIDDLGAIGLTVAAPGGEPQQIYRIGVQAVGAGEITLQPEAADAVGTATLIRGRDTEVPEYLLRYTPLSLSIVAKPEVDPLDVDGNGTLTAGDALLVINFLGRFGTTSVDELEEKVLGVAAEGEQGTDTEMEKMRRYDTSGDGKISALDALVIINDLGRKTLADNFAQQSRVDMAIDTLIEDDDEDKDDDATRIVDTLGI
jgi:hypothetical protein